MTIWRKWVDVEIASTMTANETTEVGPSPDRIAFQSPQVTVLMAVYNGETYLRPAIESVLSQTFEDFEFLIVEDRSTDSSPQILSSFDDPRIQVMPNDRNIGLTPSLNVGLRASRGQFIARMDADDICAPDRLEKQVDMMRANPSLAIIGSSYRMIDADGKIVRTKIKPLDDFQVRWVALFRTPIEHSSALIRRSILTENDLVYDERYRSAQDYDFWLRILDHGQGRVLRDVLLDYRRHDDNITSSPSMNQMTNSREIALDNISQRWPELIPFHDDIKAFFAMYLLSEPGTTKSIQYAARGMKAMIVAFCRKYSATTAQRRWINRQAAGILAEALLRRGRCGRSADTIVALIRHALPFCMPLAGRVWEDWTQSNF